MKLPVFKRILREDVKDAPAWISAVIDPFNSLAETVYQAFNRNLTFRENLLSFIKELTYTTSASYPAGDNIEFLNELKVKPTGLILLQAYDKSNYSFVAGPVYVPWIEDNGTISIGSITGLQASKTYIIRLLIL